ncbi:MAG: DUF1735 domain-containing protein [Bacteroidia bacterium]|nr:MAG: DUF1735 domain-containing protein [Bacteroidia bacterium]
MKSLNIKLMSVVTFSLLLLSSCLKDKGVEDGKYSLATGPGTEGKEYVTIPKATKAQVYAIEAKAGAQDVKLFDVSYDYVNMAEEDITATLTVNNALVTAENAETVIVPTNAYSIPSPTVTIPRGKRVSGTFTIKLTTDNMPDPTAVYGLGFTLSSVSKTGVQIPDNLKNIVCKFTVKNKYDGEYEVTGSMVDAGSATLTGYFPFNYHLITAGATTVEGFDPEVWEDYFVPIRSGGAVSGYGSFSPVFEFDANNKIIKVTNIYGQPAGNGRYAELDPSGENSWDPATKTIKVKFFMFQPASVPLPNPRVKFDWTLTYKGAR